MLAIPLQQIIDKIKKETKVSEKLIKEKIATKKKELNGLVSDEGAAYIIASEMGVDILGEAKQKLKIKDVLIGMRSVSITGRVLQKFDVKEFKTKAGKEGKVGSFTLADDTGQVRIVIWNEQVSILEKLERGVAVKVVGAYSRENRFSGMELHLGNRSKLEEVKSDLPKAEELEKVTMSASSAQPSDKVVARGIVVQAYRPNFYNVCPDCGKSAKENKCSEHGEVTPKKQIVFNIVLDNGEKCIRCVSFRDAAEKLAGVSAEEAQKVILDHNEAALTTRVEDFLKGRVIEVTGRMSYNQNYNRSEIMVNDCRLELDPLQIIGELAK